MAQGFIQSITAGSDPETYSGVITNSNGKKPVNFTDQTITTEDGTPISSPDDCGMDSAVDYSVDPSSGHAHSIQRYASVQISGQIDDQSTQAQLRNFARSLVDDSGPVDTTVVIKRG